MLTTGKELAIYLAKARRAEHLAAKFAPDTGDHEGWLKIAEGYRELAGQRVANDTRESGFGQRQ